MNVKIIFMSIIILGLIVNLSISDLAFSEKPDKENKQSQNTNKKNDKDSFKAERENEKIEREIEKTNAKTEREEIKSQRSEIKEFEKSAVVTTSSTTTICHIPPGNPGNNHTITIGESAVNAHLGHGDVGISCDKVDWEEWKQENSKESSNNRGSNQDFAQQISNQIAELQKRLQELFGF